MRTEAVELSDTTPTPVRPRRAGEGAALVIIPAFNEAESLPWVLEELRTERPDLDVVVVSDGSVDATAAVSRHAGVPVLELPFNLGIGGALRTGFRYAVEYGYGAAVQFDADGQHDPRTIHRLLDAVADGADLVIGSRFMEGGYPTYKISKVRRLAMRGLERTVMRLVGRRFTDTSSGYRGFSRRMLEYFARMYPVEYMDSVESLVIAVNGGFDLREVPCGIRGRTGGAPSTRGWKLGYYYVRLLVVLLTSYTRPRHREVSRAAATNVPTSVGVAR